MEFANLSVRVDGPIGELRLERAAKRNALSIELLEEIVLAARFFDATQGLKVVVVRGAGESFSAGADLDAFRAVPGRTTREVAELGRAMADALEAMRAVSIAAIRGWCVGGGLVLAAACDLRIASRGARFSIPEVDLGIPLAWGGIPRLVRELGPARTKELVMTCRPFEAEEARVVGFVNRVVDEGELDAATDELAGSLARKPAHALLSTKRHVNAVCDQMVGTGRAWADADGLVTAFTDAECTAARRSYLEARRRPR